MQLLTLIPPQGGYLALAAFLAGALNTAAGGGALISFPALLAVGYPAVIARVTNTAALWPGYLGGAASYKKEILQQSENTISLGMIAVLGAVLGSTALLVAPAHLFVTLAPYLILLACVLLLLQPKVAVAVKNRQTYNLEKTNPKIASRKNVYAGTFLAGIYGAYFGAGLGIVLLAVLGTLLPQNLQSSNGLKNFLSLTIHTIALVAFVAFGPIAWGAVLIMAIASLIGGYTGGYITRRLSPKLLRAAIISFGVVVATMMIFGI